MAAQIKFLSFPHSNKFPAQGEPGNLYYSNSEHALFLCCGFPSAYFPLSGILAGGTSFTPVVDATSLVGFDIAPQEGVLPTDGVTLQFDLASKTWKQVAMPSDGISPQDALVQSIAISIALGG